MATLLQHAAVGDAADRAPDAPPAARPSPRVSGPTIGRREALEIARAALRRHLSV
jgi:hypothetical protein